MDVLERYFSSIADYRNDERAIDLAHNFFLFGAATAKKPDKILELGVGTGFATLALVTAVIFNEKGKITAVDNWLDWGGKEPEFTQYMRRDGVEVITASEKEFLQHASTDEYDFLVSDADHRRSGWWLHEHLRVCKDGAFMFFHDTNNSNWPSLLSIPQRLAALPQFHFRESSRSDERCDRGWLFVINKKDTPA